MASRSRRPETTPKSTPCQQVVTVERMVAAGAGLSRLADGRPCFIEGGFPGDQLQLQTIWDKKSYARALDWQLQQPGPARVQPVCALAQRCGGCNWMELSYEAQLEAKRDILVESLRRTAKLTFPAEQIRVHPSPNPLSYRSRLRLRVTPEGVLGLLGRRSQEVVPIARCEVVTPELQEALSSLQGLLKRSPQLLEGVTEVELRALDSKPSLYLSIPSAKKSGNRTPSAKRRAARRVPTLKPAQLAALEQHFTVCQSNKAPKTWDRAPLNSRVHLQVPPGGFSQVNWQVNQAILAELSEGVQVRGLRTFADVYCGAGNFTLPLLAQGLEGIGIEGDANLIAGAKTAAAECGLTPDAFIHQDAGEWARAAVKPSAGGASGWDLVICDPPRSGIKRGLEELASLAQHHMFLCACDPVTFARDLAGLTALGLNVERLSLYDMFPQTHHFEVVAWLARVKQT